MVSLRSPPAMGCDPFGVVRAYRTQVAHAPTQYTQGGSDITWDVWVTQEQEGLKAEDVLRNLLLLHNPDAQSSVWATPPIRPTMKTKLSLLTAVVVLASLLGYAHWRASRLQRTLDYQTASIQSMAAVQASEDMRRGSASYFLYGKLMHGYEDAFASHFKEYGIRPVARGCVVDDVQVAYWDEYDRVVQDSLFKQHGKDLIQEFATSYSSNRRSGATP